MRYRITVRGDAPHRTELRGYVDIDPVRLREFAQAMQPFGLVIASPADDDYDPFGGARVIYKTQVDFHLTIKEARDMALDLMQAAANAEKKNLNNTSATAHLEHYVRVHYFGDKIAAWSAAVAQEVEPM